MRHWIFFIAAMLSVIPFTGVVAQNDDVRDGVTDRAREYVQGSGEADSILPVVYDRVTEPPIFYGGNYALEKFVLENVKYRQRLGMIQYIQKRIYGITTA